jgi:serine/threonine-protein kinase SRPK3
MCVELIKPFKDSISVRVSDEGLEEGGEEVTFTSDEEPHFLKPDHGFGFNPLKLGECLQGSKTRGGTYEIVRKLGFGLNSSVWLAKFST